MSSLDQNFRDLLTYLNSAGVRYLVLGGYAVNFHGFRRNTQDIDVWISTDAGNAERVARALRLFGFSARSVRGSMFRKKGAVFTFGREPFRVDILTDPTAVEFEPCYGRRVDADLDGVAVPFIGFDDLLINKTAAGRTKDLSDVEKLTKKKQLKAAVKRRTRKRKQ